MARAGLLVGFVMLSAMALSLYGLFNRERSVLSVIGGALLSAVSIVGALYSWVETGSVSWTAVYLSCCLLGAIATIRQLRMGRS